MNESSGFDDCLTHTDADGVYHYHFWSPCLRKGKGLWSNTVAPANCKDTPSCYDSKKKTPYFSTYALNNGYSGTNKGSLEIIGLAKDGHIIYGPWDQNGAQFDCNSRDLCNGTFFAGGDYGYVSTATFPYTVGCWGPAAP